jgi:hypothetical protein
MHRDDDCEAAMLAESSATTWLSRRSMQNLMDDITTLVSFPPTTLSPDLAALIADLRHANIERWLQRSDAERMAITQAQAFVTRRLFVSLISRSVSMITELLHRWSMSLHLPCLSSDSIAAICADAITLRLSQQRLQVLQSQDSVWEIVHSLIGSTTILQNRLVIPECLGVLDHARGELIAWMIVTPEDREQACGEVLYLAMRSQAALRRRGERHLVIPQTIYTSLGWTPEQQAVLRYYAIDMRPSGALARHWIRTWHQDLIGRFVTWDQLYAWLEGTCLRYQGWSPSLMTPVLPQWIPLADLCPVLRPLLSPTVGMIDAQGDIVWRGRQWTHPYLCWFPGESIVWRHSPEIPDHIWVEWQGQVLCQAKQVKMR